MVTVIATIAKLVGAFIGGRFGGLGRHDAFAAASALNARGALEVVIATVGLSLGVLTNASYSAIVVMAILTTAIAGPMLQASLGSGRDAVPVVAAGAPARRRRP